VILRGAKETKNYTKKTGKRGTKKIRTKKKSKTRIKVKPAKKN
jgi:hypothetical protein